MSPSRQLDEMLRRRLATRLLAAAATLLAPLAAANAQKPAKPVVSQAYLTAESVLALSLRPRQMLTNPKLSLLPIEVAKAAGEKYLGMDIANIVRAVAVGEPPLGVAPYYALFFQADRNWDLGRLAPELTAHTQPGQIGGRDCLVSRSPMLPCYMVLRGKTLVAASQGMLEKLLNRERPKAAGVLVDLLSKQPPGDDLYLAIDTEKLRPLIQLGLMQAAGQTPPELQPLLRAPDHLQSVELAFNPDGGRPSRLAFNAGTSADAEQLQQILDQSLAAMEAKMRAEAEQGLANLRASADPVERSVAAYADRVSGDYFGMFKPRRDGESFVVFDTGRDAGKGQQITQVAIIGLMVALLLPAVQAARAAARRNQSMNNLKQLMLAKFNYESVHAAFPPQAICDPNGKPLLSWRVAVLPYLEQQGLYEQFRLDEPWDSPHNQALIPLMPQVFLSSDSTLTPQQGRATYLGVSGPDYMLDGAPEGRQLRRITDGLSNTIALVEVSDNAAVAWTKPEDWSPAADIPFAGLRSRGPAGFQVGFGDGSVRPIPVQIDPETWRALLTINGRELINGDF